MLLQEVKKNFEAITNMLPKDFQLTEECLCCDSFNTNIKDKRFGYRCHCGNCIAIQHPTAFQILEDNFIFLKGPHNARKNP
jgi:hypothetical protein